ncbi:hypothetical protein IP91_00120 [Pseudoduganella lurida]|uniref:Putative DnaT-like domain-containing protein n=1 Tax=Pseudoduganella lurida TaxID=1036180 RepID=A0A562RJ06_9BURK|nr:DnaT-like ssDNA-binding protein [Pseudoduganella lurida]TWI69055.1 hypothetical protein IP91_00120 [Pseudoduganella lurida]
MALIVETGTGLANAASYASVAAADAYHASRGNALWNTLATERKEQLLRAATDYMVVYAASWSGSRQYAEQALDWPRDGAEAFDFDVPQSTVPAQVVNACAVLALKAAAGPLLPDPAQAKKRQKVGPLEVEYQDYSTSTKRYASVDAMLLPFFGAGGGSIYMARLERS